MKTVKSVIQHTIEELKAYSHLLGAHLIINNNAITIQMPAQKRQTQAGHTGDSLTLSSLISLQININTAYKFMKDWETLWSLKRDITKKELKDYIQKRLHEDTQAIRTLLMICKRQTPTELQAERTVLHNSIGFTGVDAAILTSFAKQYQTRNFLSPKQLVILKKKIVKYWQQVIDEIIVKGSEAELALYLQVKAARTLDSTQMSLKLVA